MTQPEQSIEYDPKDYVPGRGRRAEARRRRRRHRRMLAALAAVLTLIAAGAVAYVLNDRAPDGAEDAGPVGRTQQTMLFQVRGGDGAAIASALMALDPPSSVATVVLVPPQVIVDLPGAGGLPFGQALATGDPNGSRNALADLMGVTVDASWVLTEEAFAALVDGAGGITAGVDVTVLRENQVVVPQGTQQLDGGRALALMTYLADGEPEQSRLARLQTVLDGLLAALPEDAGDITDRITALGEGSQVSEPVTFAAEFTVGLQRAGAAEQLQYDTLPVIPIDPGGGVTSFRLNPESTRALVDRALAQSVPEGVRQSGNRVYVLNGVGTPGLGEAVRSRLVAADFVFVASRNAEQFGYERTQVLVPEATPAAQALGERVAAALGVEPDVRQSNFGAIADVVVIVGADFVP